MRIVTTFFRKHQKYKTFGFLLSAKKKYFTAKKDFFFVHATENLKKNLKCLFMRKKRSLKKGESIPDPIYHRLE